MIIVVPSATRNAVKTNKIEVCKCVLIVLWDASIGDPIDVILGSDYTKGGMMELLQLHTRDHLKVVNTTKENVSHKLKMF